MKKKRTFSILFWIFNLIIWFVLYYAMIVLRDTGDYPDHNLFADLMMDGKFTTVYPGYQLMVGIPHKLFGIDIKLSSVIVLTLFALFSVLMVYLLMKEILGKTETPENKALLVMSFIVTFVQPVFIKSIPPGYSSGNGYVSPTQAVCRPWALWVILVTYIMFRDEKWEIKSQVKLLILGIVSCIMKPLFAMAYVPAMGVMYLIYCISLKESLRNKVLKYIKIIWPVFFTGVFLILQFVFSYSLEMPENANYTLNGGAHLYFGFLVAWRMAVSNVPLSILFAYFFPIALLVLGLLFKSGEGSVTRLFSGTGAYLKILGSYGLVSLFYMVFLNQGADRSCDFRNAWVVTFTLTYTLCGLLTLKLINSKEVPRTEKMLAVLALAIHIVFGVLLYGRNIYLSFV